MIHHLRKTGCDVVTDSEKVLELRGREFDSHRMLGTAIFETGLGRVLENFYCHKKYLLLNIDFCC